MSWTHFWDMHSGGDLKQPPYHHIYIEAAKDEACTIFYNRFNHNPYRVSCTCCGEDYSVDQYDTLEEATAHQRACTWSEQLKIWEEKGPCHQTVHEYTQHTDVLIIQAIEISSSERLGSVPEQGYVWVD